MNSSQKLLISGLTILLSMIGMLIADQVLGSYGFSPNVISISRLSLFFIWIYGAVEFIGELLE